MIDKEKIIRYYKATEEDIIAARLIELAESVEKNKKYKASFFLSPSEFQIAEVIANASEKITVLASGGFENAERNKAVFIHQEFKYQVVPDFVAIEVTWDKRYYSIAHKDLLGAILAMCKREFVGDIVLTETGAQVVVEEKMAEFFLQNLTKVGAAEVSVSKIALEELQVKEQKTKIITATVANLRLDAVAAAGYSTSRTQMNEGIKLQQVKLNHKPAKGAAQEVKVGDVISYRGRGRVEIVEIKGITKKGRISIVLHRIL